MDGNQLWRTRWRWWGWSLLLFVWPERPERIVPWELMRIVFTKALSSAELWRWHRRLKTQQISLGQFAEAVARVYLCARGLRYIESNWRAGIGELDLIMEQAGEIVVVEVKSRLSEDATSPDRRNLSLFDNIDQRKSAKLRFLANLYFSRRAKLGRSKRRPKLRVRKRSRAATRARSSRCAQLWAQLWQKLRPQSVWQPRLRIDLVGVSFRAQGDAVQLQEIYHIISAL